MPSAFRPGSPDFDLFIGIDYSGAETPTSPLKGLQVAAARPDGELPVLWTGPRRSSNGRPVNWSRREVAERPLPGYFDPPLTLAERSVAALEGWILGVR